MIPFKLCSMAQRVIGHCILYLKPCACYLDSPGSEGFGDPFTSLLNPVANLIKALRFNLRL